MTTYCVELAPAAQADIESIYQHYIITANDFVANKLLEEIDLAIASLSSEPLLGHLPLELNSSDKECLEILTKSFRLVYRILDKRVDILLVLHQKQSIEKALNNRLLH
ncbi:MAG: type II toxin-antitoxin system RelE/ParE family toxin [Colwellia sp.]|nr:type II toxin-antitoxin system RelE/ParE family toxin [Colwellia sp.]